MVARELTKIHEEYLRGNLSDLIKIEEFKGELVLLVEGFKKEDVEIDFSVLKDKVDKLVDDNVRTKDAIKLISDKYQVSKNELYDYYHKK